MKKKFLLLLLFCSTLVLALIGLSTEKTQASIWGDDSPWMEIGGGTGIARTEQVRCTKHVDDIYYNPNGTIRDRITQTIEWTGSATFCDNSNVAASSCTPSNPC